MDQMIEFAPLVAGAVIVVLVPVLALPFRRFAFPFLWGTLGYLAARPLTTWAMRWFELDGLKVETLMMFQSATVLVVIAITAGEWLRGAWVGWRPSIASLGVLSVPMMMLAAHLLEGGGPRVYNLGVVLAWVSVAGYVTGPTALAAFVYLLTVHPDRAAQGARPLMRGRGVARPHQHEAKRGPGAGARAPHMGHCAAPPGTSPDGARRAAA